MYVHVNTDSSIAMCIATYVLIRDPVSYILYTYIHVKLTIIKQISINFKNFNFKKGTKFS